MAITFVGSANNGRTNGSTLGVAPHANTQVGDWLVAIQGSRNGGAASFTDDVNGTWTNVTSTITNDTVVAKVGLQKVVGSVPTAIDGTGSGGLDDSWHMEVLTFRGCHDTQPSVAIANSSGSGSVDADAPAVTPGHDDCAIVALVARDSTDASHGTITNYTVISGAGTGDVNPIMLGAAYRILTGGNGVSQDPAAWSLFNDGGSSNAGEYVAFTVALRPSAGTAHVGQATFAGAGSLSAQATKPARTMQASFAGAGSLSALALQNMRSLASFSGTGGLSALARQQMAASAIFNGAGSQSAAVSARLPASAIFAGEGSFSADAFLADQGVHFIEARFEGAGGLSAEARMLQIAQAVFDGQGSLSALARQTQVGSAIFDGVGGLSGYAQVNMAAFASFAGNSTFSVELEPPFILISARFAGESSLSAAARLNQAASARFDGAGSLSAYGRLRMRIAARMDGAGSLEGTLYQRMRAAARFAGAGAFSVEADIINTEDIGAVFGGVGGMLVDARVIGGATSLDYTYPIKHGLYSDYGIRASATLYKQRLVIGRR